jgi:hypothetical protein
MPESHDEREPIPQPDTPRRIHWKEIIYGILSLLFPIIIWLLFLLIRLLVQFFRHL